jgi:hypothetical protein
MSGETESAGLIEYIRDGPDAGGNSMLRRILGFWVWWRTWLMSVLLVVSIVVLVRYGPPAVEGDARWWGYSVGVVTMLLVSEVMDDG